MTNADIKSQFSAQLLRPKNQGDGGLWAFVVLPKAVSETLPRRGRTSVEGTLNGQPFIALLEPDGQKSHWLQVSEQMLEAAGVAVGDVAEFNVKPVAVEPEPEAPADLLEALDASPDARVSWDGTTTLARVDWIHWIESAKQTKTRAKRVSDAGDMLASGKKRVCCFDPSGFYSKALKAPDVGD